MIQIMQQERSFLRRVSVLKPFINENCPSSRRAYFSIRLAVKTSRPHLLFLGNTNLNCKFLKRIANVVNYYPNLITDLVCF